MPPKNKRMLEIEQDLAESIASHRKRLGLTYEGLADRMKSEGCEIHASGIQKTEKSGRRITVDELVGYSKVFGIPVESLLDIEEQLPTEVVWRDLMAAEAFRNILDLTGREYETVVTRVRREVKDNPELRDHIMARYIKYQEPIEKQAREMAVKDGFDISTSDKLKKYMEDWDWSNPIIKTALDVLRQDDGE